MQVYFNGKFIPEARAVVSVFDRGFLYGDGLFEAVLVHRGKLFRWPQHLERFLHGAVILKIKLPSSAKNLRAICEQLVERNKMTDGVVRLTMSRGVGVRGYSPAGAEHPTFVVSCHPNPSASLEAKPWKLVSSSWRLPAGDPLAQFKNCNKLVQILSRAEADTADAQEALLVNTDGFVVEGTTSNLFWIDSGTVGTSPLAAGILPGVTRAVILEVCKKLQVKFRESNVTLPNLKRMDAVFLSMTSRGIVAAGVLDGKKLKQSPLVEKLSRAYHEIVELETANP